MFRKFLVEVFFPKRKSGGNIPAHNPMKATEEIQTNNWYTAKSVLVYKMEKLKCFG